MEFVFLAVLLTLSSYFAAAETALTAINKMKVRLRAANECPYTHRLIE
ncbi:hypothetical protein [Kurthia huakuii]|nr:hypothetical protein [Kurthia huakuii]MBM7700299.1 Mg2+/Co2+ transporter CorB [Kurthia huakuii]